LEYTVNTSVPIKFEAIETSEDDRFLKTKIWLCSVGRNKNKSSFSKESIEKAIPSLSNIPIVGFIEIDNYNEADFKGHEQRIVIDKDGVSLSYIGRAYGLIPENNNAQFEIKEVDGVDVEFLTVEGIIWTKFEEATEILNRDEIKSQSMELQASSVEGTFDKDGIFNFTSFAFEAACILGDNIIPAITGSTIEKFSMSTIQSDIKDMISEFNNHFSQFNSVQVNNVRIENENDTKGGNNVDEKLELFTKFSQLTEEDVADLNANLEKYSVEELEVKLQEIADAKVEFTKTEEPIDGADVKGGDPAIDFSLTASQLRKEIYNTLSKEEYTNDWDYESRSYWYIDHDDSRVYCEDVRDSYRAVAFNYAMKGDFVEIDYSTKKMIKFVPADMEDGADINFSMVSEERNKFELTEAKATTEKEVTDKFQVVKTELENANKNNESLKSDNKELLEFKLNLEMSDKQAKIENLFSKFADLSEGDVKDLRENKEMSLEVLELNLYALRGKKHEDVKKLKDSRNKKDENIVFTLTDSINQPLNGNKPEWAEIVDRYDNK